MADPTVVAARGRAPRPVSLLRGTAAGVLEVLAPTRCLACGARAAPPWCAACAGAVSWLVPGCPRCAASRGTAHACWPTDAPVDATIALYDYRGPAAAAIVTAKLRGARAGWPSLAAPLGARVGVVAPPADAVTFVTTPARRVRERGVDHARVLGAAVASALGLPCLRLLDVEVRGGSDRYRARAELPGSDLVLVDDVVTTGTTAWRAAAALRAAGAGSITLAVLARAGTHPLGAAQR